MRETLEISLRERIRQNLVSSMEKANINQVQLAEKLGISKGTVNNWTRGNNSPDVDMVPKICDVLGISILDLYSPSKSEAIMIQKAPSISDEAISIAERYEELDGHGREAVRAILDIEWRRCKREKEKKEGSVIVVAARTDDGPYAPMGPDTEVEI